MSLIMHQVKKVIIVGLLVGCNDIKDDIRDKESIGAPGVPHNKLKIFAASGIIFIISIYRKGGGSFSSISPLSAPRAAVHSPENSC